MLSPIKRQTTPELTFTGRLAIERSRLSFWLLISPSSSSFFDHRDALFDAIQINKLPFGAMTGWPDLPEQGEIDTLALSMRHALISKLAMRGRELSRRTGC